MSKDGYVIDGLYKKAINLLNEIRLTEGPEGIRPTLRRRPGLSKFIKAYQKSSLDELEKSLDNSD